jgi:hypothetical protein
MGITFVRIPDPPGGGGVSGFSLKQELKLNANATIIDIPVKWHALYFMFE